jgi:hypothetical protein
MHRQQRTGIVTRCSRLTYNNTTSTGAVSAAQKTRRHHLWAMRPSASRQCNTYCQPATVSASAREQHSNTSSKQRRRRCPSGEGGVGAEGDIGGTETERQGSKRWRCGALSRSPYK